MNCREDAEMRLENDLLEQYRAVREDMGVLDRSGVGKLAITGPDRISWLQGMVSNDVTWLGNKATYGHFRACVLNPTGHILTDLALVPMREVKGNVRLAEALGLPNEEFLLADLPRENVEKIVTLFDRYIIMEEVEVRDVSDALGCFSFQGPVAFEGWDEGFSKERDPLAGCWEYLQTMPADHTGAGGFAAYFPSERKADIQAAISSAHVSEIGLEAQEILRVEAGLPKWGAELDESVIPLEANLGPTHISLTKGCYVGQEIIARINARGHTNRALTGLVLEADTLPAPGDKLYALPGAEEPTPRETGRITSVVASAPAVGGKPIALGYVRHEHRAPGSRLRIGDEARGLFATVVELPFFRNPVL
jgi:folate-binding protein YgfZ